MTESLILVVDDDPLVLDATAAGLRQAGFSVLVATSAKAAFRLLETRPDVALLITDIVMPGLDGLMLADMAKLRHPDLRVIYATGFGERTARQPGYRYGPTLGKPIRGAQLEAQVRAVLAGPSDRHGFRPDDTGGRRPKRPDCMA